MQVSSILRSELWGFLIVLAALVGYRLLTRQINLRGLLSRKNGMTSTSPERIQLLLATMAMSANYLNSVMQSPSNSLPDVSSNWLFVFAGSSAVYAAGKALTELKSLTRNLERKA